MKKKVNNEAAKTFLSFPEEEKQKEQQLYKHKEAAKDMTRWYTPYIHKNEIQPFDNNDITLGRTLIIGDNENKIDRYIKSNVNNNINNSISDNNSGNKSINSIDNDYAAMKKLQQDLYLVHGPS
eukprot:450781_1